MLIDIAEEKDPHHFREVLAPTPNANSKMLVSVSSVVRVTLISVGSVVHVMLISVSNST